jgi:hypothetical protein
MGAMGWEGATMTLGRVAAPLAGQERTALSGRIASVSGLQQHGQNGSLFSGSPGFVQVLILSQFAL